MSFEKPPVNQSENPDQHLITMRDEVFEIIGDDISRFREAFATVAHKHGISHGKDKATYNYHYRAVEQKVKASFASLRKRQAEGKLKNLVQRDNYEPLYKHPVLGPNQ